MPTCRWIDGDPASAAWSYCGAAALTGFAQADGVWCAAHRARVYQPYQRKARDDDGHHG